ncbi:hypothetical protein HDV03_003621 [Kappamyces sp. JEL0829]|nr:hypothetical protein HDV03_003621 [Kappamyces sp. JEL0829]
MTHKLGEGTFSEVLKVKHKTNGKVYAMKRFRKRFNSTFEEIQNLREIQALKRLNPHNHVIQLIEVIFDQKHGVLGLNFELMDCNLYELISRKSTVMTESKAKNYFFQICKGLDYMHSKGIFHRDIKPENILIKDNTIKLADFGSCRGIHSKQPYTEYIATRWYRSPECLLCDGIYTYKMDLWGAGCVLYEIITKAPLFPGSNELDQLHRIHGVLGTPSQKLLKKMLGSKGFSQEYNFATKEGTGLVAIMPAVSSDCIDLLQALLIYDPDTRINARDSLKHAFFKEYYEGRSSVTKTATIKASDDASSAVPSLQAHGPSSYIKTKDHTDSHHPADRPPQANKDPDSRVSKLVKGDGDKDISDTHSVISTNSGGASSLQSIQSAVKKEERMPVGMRRRSKKEYKINSYGSKGSLPKISSLKIEAKQSTQLPLLIDTTKSVPRGAKGVAQKDYCALPMLGAGGDKNEVHMGVLSNHTTLPSIHPK